MKKPVLIVLVCAVLVCLFFIGWRFRADNRKVLDEYGEHRSAKMDFVVELTGENPGVIIHRRLSGFDLGFISWGMTSSISSTNWSNHPGFFSVIDNEGRCWAFNGNDESWIYERTPKGGRSWDLSTWPHAIPSKVESRLPVAVLAQTRRADNTDQGEQGGQDAEPTGGG